MIDCRPKVSALVSVYKGERYIESCLENLIQQSLFQKGQLEVLVLDADSPENEGELCRKYVEAYPNRIRYERLESRFNLYKTWNLGAKIASGEYLTSANVDDIHEHSCLGHLAKRLDEDPCVGIVYGHQVLTTEDIDGFDKCRRGDINLKPSFFAPMILLQNPCGSQPMWRKQLHEELGGFNENYRILGDYDFVVRATSVTQIQLVNEAMGVFLDRPSSLSRSGMSVELDTLKHRHYNAAQILSLYASEGFDVNSIEGLIKVFEDLICRCLMYFTIWGGRWSVRCNYELAEIAAKELENYSPEHSAFWISIVGKLRTCSDDENETVVIAIDNTLQSFDFEENPLGSIPDWIKKLSLKREFSVHELAWIGCGIDPETSNTALKRINPNRKILIWGRSETGKRLSKLLKNKNIQIDAFLDRNARNLSIQNPETSIITYEDLTDFHEKAFVIIATGDKSLVENQLGGLGYVKGDDFI